jgi:rod shape-determining protein MreC
VRPYADFSRLEFVRVVDYGVTGLVSGGQSAPSTPSGVAGQRVR